jgi:GNAT superfamily N-acetyltransferase
VLLNGDSVRFASPMLHEPFTVKRLSSNLEAEWRAVHEICCRTGNNGQPISAERWPFFPRLWVEPYQKIFPQWTYAAQAGGLVIGYLTGCPDSRAFARSWLWRFALPLLIDVIRGRYSWNPDARTFVRQFFGLEMQPDGIFPREFRRMLYRDYPAHLHMNVEAAWRRRGVGAKLIEAFIGDLRGAVIPGVHLYCGADPVPFYLRQGFKELGKVFFREIAVFALGRRC